MGFLSSVSCSSKLIEPKEMVLGTSLMQVGQKQEFPDHRVCAGLALAGTASNNLNLQSVSQGNAGAVLWDWALNLLRSDATNSRKVVSELG